MKSSLADFASRIENLTDQLITRLRHESGIPIPLQRYTSYYAYDAMAAVAFGEPMGFIRSEQSETAASILSTLTNGVKVMGYMYHMPWLMNTLAVLTSVAGPIKEWRDWSVSQMKARMAVRLTSHDITMPLTRT